MSLSILFLCDRNAARSPMAAGLLRKRGFDSISSAGLTPADMMDGFAITLMRDDGIDIAGDVPAPVAPDALNADTLVIALTPAAFAQAQAWRRERGFALDYWELPELPDPDQPRDMVLAGYRQVRDAIKAHIKNRFG